ncbi:14628_t:CDS:2, partial [Rhizophagus irregularis]
VTENLQTIGNVLWRDFLDSNDLSVEDFWIVLYFQTLPYGTLDL